MTRRKKRTRSRLSCNVAVAIDVRSRRCRLPMPPSMVTWKVGRRKNPTDPYRFVHGGLFYSTRAHIIAPHHPLGCPWVRFVWTGAECTKPISHCAVPYDTRVCPRRCSCVFFAHACVWVCGDTRRCVSEMIFLSLNPLLVIASCSLQLFLCDVYRCIFHM